MNSQYIERMCKILAKGDIELRFHDGRSTKAHSQKLILAGMGGPLSSSVEELMSVSLAAFWRKLDEAEDNGAETEPPGPTVRPDPQAAC